MSQEQLHLSPLRTGLEEFSFLTPDDHVTTRMRVPATSPSASPVITAELARADEIDEKWGQQYAAAIAAANELASK